MTGIHTPEWAAGHARIGACGRFPIEAVKVPADKEPSGSMAALLRAGGFCATLTCGVD